MPRVDGPVRSLIEFWVECECACACGVATSRYPSELDARESAYLAGLSWEEPDDRWLCGTCKAGQHAPPVSVSGVSPGCIGGHDWGDWTLEPLLFIQIRACRRCGVREGVVKKPDSGGTP